MNPKISGLVGVVGGAVDLAAGLVLQQQSMMEASMMTQGTSALGGYFLIVLGILVLATGLCLLVSPMMRPKPGVGWLMIVYGVTMLLVAVAMFGRVFSMMQGSDISGAVMVLVGVAMFYSGSQMAKKRM